MLGQATEAVKSMSWFAEAAEIDLTAGGQMTRSWQEHGRFHAVVEWVEPPRFFSFRRTRRAGREPREESAPLVEFSVSPEGDRTRLRVVESGFRTLDLADEAWG